MAAVAGDRAAFGLLPSQHRPALARFCLRLTSDPATAEDCTPDASWLAYLRLDPLRSPEWFGGWLNGIGRHTCHHAVRAHPHGSTPLTDVLELAVSETGSPVTAVTRSELSQDLRTAVGELPAAQREAVQVFYVDGHSYSEAVDTLGISLSALKVRCHDARRTVKHRYRLEDAAAPAISRRNPRTLALHEAGHAVLLWSHDANPKFRSSRYQRFGSASQPKAAKNFQLPVTIRLQMHMAGEAARFVQGRWSASLEQADATAHCIGRGDDQAVIVFAPRFDRANLFGQPPGDLVLITRVSSRNRSASVIVDRNAFEIPTSRTVRSVRRFVPLKRYPCWCQAAQPEL